VPEPRGHHEPPGLLDAGPSDDAAIALRSTCANYGVVVGVSAAGNTAYCATDACDNEGVLILVAVLGSVGSCEGGGSAVLCAGSTRVLPPPEL